MALGKELGDFSFKWTSLNYAEDGSGGHIDVDGTASGFGTVLGTLYFRGQPTGKSGSHSWRGSGFLDNGEVVTGTGEGLWQESGKHQWRVRGTVETSDGQTFASDGTLDLASRTYNGKLLEWT